MSSQLVDFLSSELPAPYRSIRAGLPDHVFRATFPGVPVAHEGKGRGRTGAIITAFAEDPTAPLGGHMLVVQSRTWNASKESMPSLTFEVFGPSPNMAGALDGLLQLHRDRVAVPMVAVLSRERDAARSLVRGWAGNDLVRVLADVIARARVPANGAHSPHGALPAGWGTFCGLPERPAAFPAPGKRGYPVDAWVTHPDDDVVDGRRRGYRTLLVSARAWSYDTRSGETGIARWLVGTGWRVGL